MIPECDDSISVQMIPLLQNIKCTTLKMGYTNTLKIGRASPKSANLRTPSRVIKTLAAFMSRWRIEEWWIWWRPDRRCWNHTRYSRQPINNLTLRKKMFLNLPTIGLYTPYKWQKLELEGKTHTFIRVLQCVMVNWTFLLERSPARSCSP